MKLYTWPGTLFAVALLLGILPAVRAQESSSAPVISTERPTAGPSPDVLPQGSMQFESGVGLTWQPGQVLADLPESLLRVSLGSRWEARLLTSNMVYGGQSASGSRAFESADTAISAKVLLSQPNRLLPRSSIFSLGLPTGGHLWTSGSVDPGLAVIWTQSFAHGWFINEVGQATLTTYGGGRRAFWTPSIAAGRPITSRLGLIAEYAPSILPDTHLTHILDGGFALTPVATRQIDLRIGILADEAGSHMLLGLGYSFRAERLPRMMGAFRR